MGGHTVGRAAAAESGYEGAWKGRGDTFSTGYYVSLLARPWHSVASSFGGQAVNQWNTGPANAPPGGPIMLNSDMEVRGVGVVYGVGCGRTPGSASRLPQLIYNLVPGTAFPNACPAFATSISSAGVAVAARNPCPFISSSAPAAAFPALSSAFATGSAATQDEPGASWWLANFTVSTRCCQCMHVLRCPHPPLPPPPSQAAFKAMTEHAYGPSAALGLPAAAALPVDLGALGCPCMKLGTAADAGCAGGACAAQCPTCQLADVCTGQTNWATSVPAASPSSIPVPSASMSPRPSQALPSPQPSRVPPSPQPSHVPPSPAPSRVPPSPQQTRVPPSPAPSRGPAPGHQ